MKPSHNKPSNPSILLALVCLAVVHRLRPGWIAITLEEAALSETVSPERLSRLCSRALVPFQRAIEALTRIGRPVRETPDEAPRLETALLSSLLGVATDLLRHVSLRKPAIRALVMGAYLRLK